MTFKPSQEFMAELLGTMVLILLGCGVVAMVVLFQATDPAIPGQIVNGGYTNITLGWGFAVLMGIFISGTISGADVRALAGAASSATLESFVLYTGETDGYKETGRLVLSDALPLLQARMPRLRQLRLPVLRVSDRELRAAARQLGRPLEVLRAQLVLGAQ